MLVIILLICPSYVPFVSASSDGISIDASTISLTDFDKIEQSIYQLEFDIEIIGTPSGTTSFVNISFVMETISGVVISNTIENYSLSASESIQVSHNFTEIPYGYVVISVSMTGDVASSSPTHVSSFQRTLQRLNPLDISVGQSDSIIIEGIDSIGQNTGNLSVNDGDYIQLQIPVINDGDFDWSGFVTVNVSDSSGFENTTSQLFSVNAMQTSIYLFNSSIMMNEGQLSIHIWLNNSGDGDASDESVNFISSINPPPLPIISLLLEEVTTEIIAGETMTWNLKVSNSGEVGFDGNISCEFDQFLILNDSLILESNSEVNISVSTSARPGLLSCEVSNDRISQNSQFETNLSLLVESAEFETAGGSIPAKLMGPWHEGDDVRLSILVRNHGSKSGNVKIVCEVAGITYAGDSIQLGVDEAGEIYVDVPMMESGLQMLNWSLQSTDGSIDSGLFGVLNISVAERQTVEISISRVSWDEQNGLSYDWGVNLSEGVQRDVRVRLGYIDSLQESYLLDTVMSLSPGLTEGTIDLGFIDADKVIVRANEDNWVAGFGFTSLSVNTPQERAIYSISFDPQTTPNRPVAGESANVKINLENSGMISGAQGNLILMTSSGVLIGERTVEPLDSQTTKTEQFNLQDWPTGDEVSLVVTWEVSRQVLTADEIFISSATQTEEESSEVTDFIPGILGGIALAAAVILVVRIINSRQDQGSKPEKKKTEPSDETKPALSDVKIQIGCPECSRQLRVPANYSGSVRCPDCNHNFDVEEEQEEVEEEQEEFENETVENIVEDQVEQEQEQEQEMNDGKTEVACPECSQTLRIPSSYSGSVRCPACKNIFRT
tara:strand:+ start:5960 stop:8470 length:2511 start_codon:yes stop_codon:yes gene_type:complete